MLTDETITGTRDRAAGHTGRVPVTARGRADDDGACFVCDEAEGFRPTVVQEARTLQMADCTCAWCRQVSSIISNHGYAWRLLTAWVFIVGEYVRFAFRQKSENEREKEDERERREKGKSVCQLDEAWAFET